MSKPRPGDKIYGRTILEVLPYDGKNKKWFDCFVVFEYPCKAGSIKMAYRSDQEIHSTPRGDR